MLSTTKEKKTQKILHGFMLRVALIFIPKKKMSQQQQQNVSTNCVAKQHRLTSKCLPLDYFMTMLFMEVALISKESFWLGNNGNHHHRIEKKSRYIHKDIVGAMYKSHTHTHSTCMLVRVVICTHFSELILFYYFYVFVRQFP